MLFRLHCFERLLVGWREREKENERKRRKTER